VEQNERQAVRQSTPAFAFSFLVLPYGISNAFVSIPIPSSLVAMARAARDLSSENSLFRL
jgi:hypothetical protein